MLLTPSGLTENYTIFVSVGHGLDRKEQTCLCSVNQLSTGSGTKIKSPLQELRGAFISPPVFPHPADVDLNKCVLQ